MTVIHRVEFSDVTAACVQLGFCGMLDHVSSTLCFMAQLVINQSIRIIYMFSVVQRRGRLVQVQRSGLL